MSLHEQALRAKQYYEQPCIETQLHQTANCEMELMLMKQMLDEYSNLSDCVFLHIGAGQGRFVCELAQMYFPKESIVVDIADSNIKALQKMQEANTHIPLRVVHEDFFTARFTEMRIESVFVFMNWSIIAECGSREGVVTLFRRLYEAFDDMVIIGDAPMQETYFDEIVKYATINTNEDIGILSIPFDDNTMSHKGFIPSIVELYALVAREGYTYFPPTEYFSEGGQKRYFFQFSVSK